MANKKRIPSSLVAGLCLIPVAAVVFWISYDSGPKPKSVQPAKRTDYQDEAQLKVRVTAAQSAVEGANVVALSVVSRRRVLSEHTDRDGRVLFEKVPPGRTAIGVIHPDYERAKRELTLEPNSESSIEIELSRRAGEPAPTPSSEVDDAEAEPPTKP